MNSRMGASLILTSTLVLGIVLGVFGAGAIAQQRRGQVERLRAPGGFVEHMERVIAPRDEAQRAALRPFIEATDEQNRRIIVEAEASILESLQSMARQVEDELDAEQRARLAREVARARPLGGPPRGGPRPDGGRPPEGGPPPGGRAGGEGTQAPGGAR